MGALSQLEPRQRLVLRWAVAYIGLLSVAGYVFFDLLSGSDNVETWQNAVAWLAFGSLLFAIVAANSYLKHDATSERERRHLRAIHPQLINAKPASMTVSRDAFRDRTGEFRETILGLWGGQTPDQPTVRDSLAEFRVAWRERTRVVPDLALKLVYEGVLLLVFGAIVILPASWWSGGETAGLEVAVPSVGGWVWAAVTAFPGVELVAALALAGVLVVGEWLFTNWFVASLALLTLAVALVWLDRVTAEDLSVTLYPNRRATLAGFAVFATLVYVSGAVAATVVGGVFGLVGLSVVGDLAGLAVAAYLVAVFGVDALADLRARLVTRQDRPGENTELVAAYLVVRKVAGLAGLAFLPLLGAHVVTAVGSGHLFAVAGEVATAPWHIRGPALAIVLVSVLLVRAAYPDLVAQLVDATRRALSSSVIRGWLFARGVPVLALLATFAFAWALFGTAVAAVVALVVGATVRLGTLAWQASKYRFVEFAERDPGASEVVVEAFTLADADGVPIYVARVGGHELAHRDREVLADVVVRELDERFESGETRPSFAHYYYDEAVSHGHVDIQFVADEFMGDIKTRIQAALRDADGRLEVEQLDKEMTDDVAEPAYRKAIRDLESRGDLDVRRGKYVRH